MVAVGAGAGGVGRVWLAGGVHEERPDKGKRAGERRSRRARLAATVVHVAAGRTGTRWGHGCGAPTVDRPGRSVVGGHAHSHISRQSHTRLAAPLTPGRHASNLLGVQGDVALQVAEQGRRQLAGQRRPAAQRKHHKPTPCRLAYLPSWPDPHRQAPSMCCAYVSSVCSCLDLPPTGCAWCRARSRPPPPSAGDPAFDWRDAARRGTDRVKRAHTHHAVLGERAGLVGADGCAAAHGLARLEHPARQQGLSLHLLLTAQHATRHAPSGS
jgi:hypothetical protein